MLNRSGLVLSLLLFLFYGYIGNVYATSVNEGKDLQSYKINADGYFKNYKYDSAAIYYDSALQMAYVMQDERYVAKLLQLKGNALLNAEHTDSALVALKASRQMAISLKHDSLSAMANISIGHIYDKYGKLDTAEYYFKHALDDFENINDTVGIGKALYNLSEFYQSKIDYETALKYALESNRIFIRFNETELYCRSLLNLGNVYERLKEYDTALACYELGKQLNIGLNNLQRAASFANNKAVIYYYQKEYEKAENELLNAIEFNEKINNTKQLSNLYRNISVIISKLNRGDEALFYAEKALDYAKQLNNIELISDALVNLGVRNKKLGNLEKAEGYYLEGAKLAEDHNLWWDMKTAYENITLLYEAKSDYGKAYSYLKKFISISDSITNKEKIRAREKYKAEYELLHYKDQNRIKVLEMKEVRFERNLSYGIGATLVFLLVLLVLFLRMRARKNRIIAAQKIQKLEDEKRLMAAQAALVGQEKERERIARELHDGIGVLLSSASIHFSSVQSKTDKKTGEMIKKAYKLLKEAGHEVRQISHNMMPGVLSKFGLREAIEDLFDELIEATKIETDIDIACSDDKRLPENMEIMIYRIVQEMLNNSLKYAKASKIRFHVTRCDEQVQMQFSDDGIGFDEASLPHDKSLGLSGIRSRVDYLGGKMTLESAPGKGTSYSITIPLPNDTKSENPIQQ